MNRFFGAPNPHPEQEPQQAPEQETAPYPATADIPEHEQQRWDEERRCKVRYTPPHVIETGATGQHPGRVPEAQVDAQLTPFAEEDVDPDPVDAPTPPITGPLSEEPNRSTVLTVSGIESGGDVVVSGRDLTQVYNSTVRYEQGAALLRSREIGPEEILSDKRFVPVGEPRGTLSGACVLIGPRRADVELWVSASCVRCPREAGSVPSSHPIGTNRI